MWSELQKSIQLKWCLWSNLFTEMFYVHMAEQALFSSMFWRTDFGRWRPVKRQSVVTVGWFNKVTDFEIGVKTFTEKRQPLWSLPHLSSSQEKLSLESRCKCETALATHFVTTEKPSSECEAWSKMCLGVPSSQSIHTISAKSVNTNFYMFQDAANILPSFISHRSLFASNVNLLYKLYFSPRCFVAVLLWVWIHV